MNRRHRTWLEDEVYRRHGKDWHELEQERLRDPNEYPPGHSYDSAGYWYLWTPAKLADFRTRVWRKPCWRRKAEDA